MTWLPPDWQHPELVPLTPGYHLRPVRAADVDLDYPAVMGSRDRLWTIYGAAWGWPPAGMTHQQDLEDLAHHEAETRAHESFLYGLFDARETALCGCVYVDPPNGGPAGCDAVVSWWVVDALVGSDVAAALDAFVPRWIEADWPLLRPHYGVVRFAD